MSKEFLSVKASEVLSNFNEIVHCADHALLYVIWWIAKETLKISSFHMICTKTTVTTFKADTLIQSNWNYAGCGGGGASHKNSF